MSYSRLNRCPAKAPRGVLGRNSQAPLVGCPCSVLSRRTTTVNRLGLPYPKRQTKLPYHSNRLTLLYEQSYPDVGTELPYIRFKVTLLSGSRGTFVKE